MPANSGYTVNMVMRADARRMRRDLNAAKREWQTFGNQISSIGRTMGVAIIAASAAVGGAVTGIVRTGREFERAMSELSAITGAVGEDLDNLGASARNMAKVSSFSAGQAATAFKLVASAKPDLLENAAALGEVTKNALTLAEAAGIDLPTAANSLGSALNQFSADAEEASRFINVLAAGSKFGASSINEVAIALKNSGVVAANLGLSFESTNAALQVLGANAIKGGEAGTQLRGVLLKLEKAGGDYSVVTHGLSTALKNLADDQLTVTELTKIFGLESVVGAQILSRNADAVAELSEKLTGTNIAFEQAAIQMDNLAGDILLLKSATDEFLISAYEEGGVGEWARSVVQSITNLVGELGPAGKQIGNIFTALFKTLRSLGDELLFAVKAFIVFKATLLAASVIGSIVSLGKAIAATVKAVKALTAASVIAAIASFSKAALIGAVAIAALTSALEFFTKNEAGQGIVSRTFNDLKDGVSSIIGEFNKLAVVLPDFERELTDTRKATTEEFEKIQDAIKEVAVQQVETTKEVVEETKEASDEIAKIWENMVTRMQDAFAESIHTSIWEEGIRGFKGFADTIIDIWKRTISELIAAWATSGITRVIASSGLFSGLTGSLGASVGGGASTGIFSTIGSAIGGKLIDPVRTAFTSAVSNVTGIGAAGAGLATSAGYSLLGAGTGTFSAGLGASLTSGFGAYGSLTGLFNVGANAAIAGGGFAATIGAAIPVIGAAIVGAGVLDKLLGGAIFGGKTRLRDSGIELSTQGAGLSGRQFGDFKRSGGLFSSTRRFTRYEALAEDTLAALRATNQSVFQETALAVEAFGLSADSLDDFTTRVKISLKGLDEEASQNAIAEAFANIQQEMFAFAISANGLVIPAENAAQAMQKITEAAQIVQQAADRAAAIAAGRINTVGLLQQSLTNATRDELQRLLRAANAEIRQGGGQVAVEIRNSIQQELSKRAQNAQAATVVGRILESANIVVQGINDLTLLAQAATSNAFSFVRSTIQTGGDAIASSTVELADKIASSAATYVARLTSIAEPSEQVRNRIPSFQTGGIVPGPRSRATLAVVHGQEEIIPADERGRGVTINISQTVTGDADASALRALRANAAEFATVIEDEILQRGSLI